MMLGVTLTSDRSTIGLAALLLGILLALVGCTDDSPDFLYGMVREPLPNVSHVMLPEVSDGGEDLAMQADPGRILVTYFGYLSCPDICPTTMADLRDAVEDLGDDSESVDVAFITVDPDRDTDDNVTNYVQAFFDDRGIALRTEDSDLLLSVAGEFGAAYEVSKAADGAVEVAHSAFLYAIDEFGVIRVQWPFGMTVEDIHHDLELLFDEMN
jgi:protein SCO1/2